MRSTGLGCALVVTLLVTLPACEVDLIDDPGFQIWCGETLCNWALEEGEIARVSTWHDHDYGVELIGSPVVLSQQGRSGATCVRVETVSHVAASAEVTVEIDVEDDGVIDEVVPVPPTTGFESRRREVRLDASTETVYFVRKSGTGRAVLARVRIDQRCPDLRR